MEGILCIILISSIIERQCSPEVICNRRMNAAFILNADRTRSSLTGAWRPTYRCSRSANSSTSTILSSPRCTQAIAVQHHSFLIVFGGGGGAKAHHVCVVLSDSHSKFLNQWGGINSFSRMTNRVNNMVIVGMIIIEKPP